MGKSIDDYIPGVWERCDTCGFYDPEEIMNHHKLKEQIATEGVESFLDGVSMDPASMLKLKNSLDAIQEIQMGKTCSCAFPHAINRYRIFDHNNKYIRVTATTYA